MDSEVERDIQKALKIAGRQAKSQVKKRCAKQSHLSTLKIIFSAHPGYLSIILHVQLELPLHSLFIDFIHLSIFFCQWPPLFFSSSTEHIAFGVLVPSYSRRSAHD